MDTVFIFAQFFVVTVIMAFALKFGNQRLKAYYDGRPHLIEELLVIPNQSTDALVFDKAEKAESVERLRVQLTDIENRAKAAKQIIEEAENAKAVEAAEAEISGPTTRKARIEALIDRKEAKISGA